MKRFVIVFIAWLFLVHFPCLKSIHAQYLVDWSRTYGDNATTECRSICSVSGSGYALAGWTIKSGHTDADISLTRLDASHNGLWFKTYGGSGNDYAYYVKQTADGGYIIAGESQSPVTGTDAYLIRTDANGDTLWTRSYGKAGHDETARSVCFAPNGDYLIVGTDRYQYGNYDDVYLLRVNNLGDTLWTRRWNFHNDWDRADQIQPTSDGGFAIVGHSWFAWPYVIGLILIKVDSLGNMSWEKEYGVRDEQRGASLQQTADKGYILVGYTETTGSSNQDVYLIKTDSLGVVEWQKTYGGNAHDHGLSVIQIAGGGYVVSGYTSSFGSGGKDLYFIRLDSDGDTIWTRTCGGAADDVGWQVELRSGGSYAVGGTSASFGESAIDWASYLIEITDAGTVQSEKTYQCEADFFGQEIQSSPASGYAIAGYAGCYRSYDASLIRLANNGEFLWMKTYGGSKNDRAYSLKALPDNGFIIVGETYSVAASGEAYLIRTDANGDTLWTRTYGIVGHDEVAHSVCLAPNGDFVVAGTDRYQHGNYDDVYLLRVNNLGDTLWTRRWNFHSGLDRADQIQPTSDGGFAIIGHSWWAWPHTVGLILIKVDSLGNMSWEKEYGVRDEQRGASLQQTSDKGYILVGYTETAGSNNQDVYLIKTDSLGVVEWQKTYGDSGDDQALSVLESEDGHFLIAGFSDHSGNTAQDVYLLGTNADGDALFTQLIGGEGDEIAYSVLATGNEGLMIAGCSTRKDGRCETYTVGLLWPVDVDDEESEACPLPGSFTLSQNYPNPFNPETIIEYSVPRTSRVTIDIYNILGEHVCTLVDETQLPGRYKATWMGRTSFGKTVPSAVYFYRLKAGAFVETRKMLLLK